MPVKQGTFGTSPIYNGVYTISSIYRGTDLVYTADALAKEFIKPFVVPESYNTNLVFNTTIKNTSAPYETKVVEGGNLYTLGNNTRNARNGILDKTQNTSVTDFYIPSTHNGVQVYSLSQLCLDSLYSTYPNLQNIIIGEGIEVLGYSALWYGGTTNTSNVTNPPKIRLPKSLKNISYRSLGNVRLYEFDTSKYTFYTYWSNNDYPVGNLGSVFYYTTVERCYVNNPIFENNYASTLSSSNVQSPLMGVAGFINTFKNLYIKNISKLGEYSLANNAIENLHIDDKLKSISSNAFNGCSFKMDVLKLPKTISLFNYQCIPYDLAGGTIRFEHTNSDPVEFTLNSSNYGPFYYKTARALNIYTDNDYIKNHDWSKHENITATLYHLDGTAW
jgi:hypothetical protein